jgi:hypothetical protein
MYSYWTAFTANWLVFLPSCICDNVFLGICVLKGKQLKCQQRLKEEEIAAKETAAPSFAEMEASHIYS